VLILFSLCHYSLFASKLVDSRCCCCCSLLLLPLPLLCYPHVECAVGRCGCAIELTVHPAHSPSFLLPPAPDPGQQVEGREGEAWESERTQRLGGFRESEAEGDPHCGGARVQQDEERREVARNLLSASPSCLTHTT